MKNLVIGLLSLFTITLNAQHLNNTQEFINQLFIATDQGEWQVVEQSFAPRVILDYSSMTGKPATEIIPTRIVESWKSILPGFDYTHHQVSNFIIEQNENTTKVFCYGTATHYLENEGENLWTVIGTYDFDLTKKKEKWLITKMRFNFKSQSGNIKLPQLAIENLTSKNYIMKKVTFKSEGLDLVGDLYLPKNYQEGKKYPAVPILGPMTYAKEQAPTEYAKRFAERGYIALAFDPRYRGESSGVPRELEDPIAKVEDAKAAAKFLASLSIVNDQQIVGFAVCQGSSEMLRAVSEDDLFKGLVTVAGHYRDREGDIQWMGTEEALEERIAAGKVAYNTFKQTGEVINVPAVDQARMDVGMPGKFVWDWYHTWSDRGIWVNNYPKMSDALLFEYESLTAAQKLDKPYLMIHSDNSFLPEAAKRQFKAVPTTKKKLQWEGETGHLQYYDDPEVLDRTANQAIKWYNAIFK
ncbi:nuclear transport factor 2 family protein [uncultured Aquimarina sp.]|uniref:nuclear transport factor 2 family protein n=1 Tax=uncultured Aquimarina sp. TaxID=575652 RepID=UPI00262FE9CE|nr:nuclear transport factor 2 family protein [uncultured Aquimarina sp.]